VLIRALYLGLARLASDMPGPGAPACDGGADQASQGGMVNLDLILRTLPLSGRQEAWGGEAES
jgi:hypothetical protein